MKGKLIIFSGPSGAGKTTIVKHLLKKISELDFSISACTREKRNDEADGKDYYFYDIKTFKKKIDNNEFLEWEEVYKGHYYGTLWSELKRIWSNNKHVVFDVDVVGGLNIKKQYPDHSLSVFVKPLSVKILNDRLEQRSTENKANLEFRKNKAISELEYEKNFDEIIVNDDLQIALLKAETIVWKFLKIRQI